MVASDRKLVALVFHVSIFCMYVYSLYYYIVRAAGAPHRQTYAGILKFFTFWNQVVRCFYLKLTAYCLLCGFLFHACLLMVRYCSSGRYPCAQVMLKDADNIYNANNGYGYYTFYPPFYTIFPQFAFRILHSTFRSSAFYQQPLTTGIKPPAAKIKHRPLRCMC